MTVIRHVDTATRDHERQHRTQAECNDGTAAPASIHHKSFRPPMYAGQGPVLRVIMRLWSWLCDRRGAFVPDNDHLSRIPVNDGSKPRTRQQPSPITKPPRSTGPWPACRRATAMLSPSASLIGGRAPGLRLVDTATRDHERQHRVQAGYCDGTAAPASIHRKSFRPPMHATHKAKPDSASIYFLTGHQAVAGRRIPLGPQTTRATLFVLPRGVILAARVLTGFFALFRDLHAALTMIWMDRWHSLTQGLAGPWGRHQAMCQGAIAIHDRRLCIRQAVLL